MGRLSYVIRPSVFVDSKLSKLGSSIPQRMGDRNTNSFVDYISKVGLLSPWERLLWVVKLPKSWEKLYLQRDRERIHNCKFSIIPPRNGSSETDSQGEVSDLVNLRGTSYPFRPKGSLSVTQGGVFQSLSQVQLLQLMDCRSGSSLHRIS